MPAGPYRELVAREMTAVRRMRPEACQDRSDCGTVASECAEGRQAPAQGHPTAIEAMTQTNIREAAVVTWNRRSNIPMTRAGGRPLRPQARRHLNRNLDSHGDIGAPVPCRKSNRYIVVQPAENWGAKNVPGSSLRRLARPA